jgi:DNA-binding transcriptional MocR family regulator
MLPDAMADLAAAHQPKLLYTVPTFHNPTGRTVPVERRRAIAATAERAGLWLVEDDPYSELRYDGEPVPALAALASAQTRVIAISTLSKVLAPGLRIGWLRARQPLLRRLTIAKQAADLHTSTIDQAAAAHWLMHNDLEAHTARLRAAYRSRRDALLSGLHQALPDGSQHNHPAGGMFIWARLPDGWDATALLPRALERDVAYVPGEHFFTSGGDPATLRLSFTTHPPHEIDRGLERLAGALMPRASGRAAAAARASGAY